MEPSSIEQAVPGRPGPLDTEGDNASVLYLGNVGGAAIRTAEADVARLPAQHVDLREHLVLRDLRFRDGFLVFTFEFLKGNLLGIDSLPVGHGLLPFAEYDVFLVVEDFVFLL